MSRIQEILRKAEREGTVHRTRGPIADGPAVSQASALAPALPLRGAPADASAEPRSWTAPSATVDRQAAATLDPRLVAALAPRSLAAEQYRSLRTRIRQAENGRAMRAIIVTSPGKGDGKSLTAANLALTMAQEFQQRVLLVDADMRRPATHALFGIADSPGLADVLMGGATLDDALVSIADHDLAVLPSGIPPSHPAELLGSAAMRRTLDTLRTRFDRVILDMPPVEPLADVHVLSPLADGLLLIVRAGQTARPAIDRALGGLDVSKVLGLVLNEAGDDNDIGYGGYGYVAG